MSIPKGAKVFNVIRENSSKVFMETIPSATEDNIATLSNILFNDAYQPMLNEFVNNLINRIGLTIVRNKTFNNPLYKKDSVELKKRHDKLMKYCGKYLSEEDILFTVKKGLAKKGWIKDFAPYISKETAFKLLKICRRIVCFKCIGKTLER